MEPGELWAYRKRAVDPLEPVTYLRHRRGDQPKHKYSLVRFEAEDADGREEWVPDGRLKCPWDEADAYVLEERRWGAVSAASSISVDMEAAIAEVLDLVLPDRCGGRLKAPTHIRDTSGVFMFRDITTLSTLTGLSADELCGEPTAFTEGDTWVVPARTAWAIAEKVAERVAGPIIEGVERDERELSSEQRHWKLLTPNREPDKQTEESWERRRESIRYRREWIGAENNSLRQQALNAESEAERLRGLVEWGISKLAGYGHKSSAETLRRNLGAES